MRVVLVSEVYPPRAGGAGWSTRALALGLRAAGHEVSVLTTSPGPSEDGGFYLIGCRGACPPGVFAGIEWSTSHTCSDTEARLRSLGRAVVMVTPWFDVDGVDDLHRLRDVGARLRRAAPETARVLESLDLS